MAKFLAVLFILFLVIVGFMWFGNGTPQNAETVEAVPVVQDIQIDQGIVLPGTFISAITHAEKVRVYGTDTPIAVKGYNSDGFLEITLPRSFGNNLAMLTTSEAQEYVLRVLMISENGQIDTSSLVLDANVLRTMAKDTSVQRVEQPSEVFNTYVFNDLAKHAIDKNTELGEYALDKQAQVSRDGYTAVTAVAVSADWSGAFMIGGLIVLALLVLLIITRKPSSQQ